MCCHKRHTARCKLASRIIILLHLYFSWSDLPTICKWKEMFVFPAVLKRKQPCEFAGWGGGSWNLHSLKAERGRFHPNLALFLRDTCLHFHAVLAIFYNMIIQMSLQICLTVLHFRKCEFLYQGIQRFRKCLVMLIRLPESSHVPTLIIISEYPRSWSESLLCFLSWCCCS